MGAARHPELHGLGQQPVGRLAARGARRELGSPHQHLELAVPVRAQRAHSSSKPISSRPLPGLGGGRGISLNSKNHIITWQLYAANKPRGGLANLKLSSSA